jgi:hypothetical protein
LSLKVFATEPEQDHRAIKQLVKPGMGFGSFNTARRTLKGYEIMNMLRKGQIKGVAKGHRRTVSLHQSNLWSSCINNFLSQGVFCPQQVLQHNPGLTLNFYTL